jgi:hypothetical protein
MRHLNFIGSDAGLSGRAARTPTVSVIRRAAIEISDAANQSARHRLPDERRGLLTHVTYPHDAGVLLFASRSPAPKAVLVPTHAVGTRTEMSPAITALCLFHRRTR